MQANGVGAAGTAASVAAVAAPPAAGSVAAEHPAKLTRDASPELSRGSLLKDHLKECFPLETSESDCTKLVKDSLSKSSKEALVGWTSGAKEDVAAQHKISAAPRGRSWNWPLFCELPVGTASLMQA